MPEPSELPLALVIAIFCAAAAVIAVAGTRLARIADELAVRTGLGEAMIGAVLVGASTSLPGIVTSVVAAGQGHVGLAASNALGGIAAQTAFLGLADIAYRRANLEHAAASAANLVQATLLVALLAVPLLAANLPAVTIYSVSPFTPALIALYLFGLRLFSAAGNDPMWRPRRTRHTQREEDEKPGKVPGSTAALWGSFATLAVLLASMGYIVSQTGIAIATLTGLSETAVGALFTAIATSLPELAIAVAAVRLGALNLAVGNIIGGNCFDVLFLAAADLAYRDGSLYAHFGPDEIFLAGAAILMTSVLLLGLLHRERHGFAGIGFESALVLGIYVAVITAIAVKFFVETEPDRLPQRRSYRLLSWHVCLVEHPVQAAANRGLTSPVPGPPDGAGGRCVAASYGIESLPGTAAAPLFRPNLRVTRFHAYSW